MNLWKIGSEKEKKGRREDDKEALRDRGRIACDGTDCIVYCSKLQMKQRTGEKNFQNQISSRDDKVFRSVKDDKFEIQGVCLEVCRLRKNDNNTR